MVESTLKLPSVGKRYGSSAMLVSPEDFSLVVRAVCIVLSTVAHLIKYIETNSSFMN